jgi:hypothetical protein
VSSVEQAAEKCLYLITAIAGPGRNRQSTIGHALEAGITFGDRSPAAESY